MSDVNKSMLKYDGELENQSYDNGILNFRTFIKNQ